MKSLFVACLLLLVFSTISFGEFLILPLDERIKNSNLIVIGTLESVSERKTTEVNYYQGILVIEKIVFGNIKTTQDSPLKVSDKLQIKWQNSNMIACRLMFSESYKAVWFLQIDGEGNVESLTPSSRTSLDDLTQLKRLLKQQKHSIDVRFVRTQNDFGLPLEPLAIKGNPKEVAKNVPFIEEYKEKTYSPLLALFVILTSIMFYYFLYRSKFKIR